MAENEKKINDGTNKVKKLASEIKGLEEDIKSIEDKLQKLLNDQQEARDLHQQYPKLIEDLKNAKEQVGQNKSPLVALEFTENGATKFANLTAANIGRHIGIYLDGEMLTNPVVNEAITGGSAVISGQRTLEEAKDLAILLRSGALPVKMSVLEVRTVGPSLGQDSKDKSVTAFTIGLSLIVLFM